MARSASLSQGGRKIPHGRARGEYFGICHPGGPPYIAHASPFGGVPFILGNEKRLLVTVLKSGRPLFNCARTFFLNPKSRRPTYVRRRSTHLVLTACLARSRPALWGTYGGF